MFLVCKQTWTPPPAASEALNFFENILEMRRLLPPKVGGSRTQKSGPQNITKLVLENPKKFFVYCFVVTKVQKQLIELKVTLL